MEIVTDSSIRSADEAFAYLTKIRQVVRYLEASSGDMEKGAMRCEANISIRPFGSEKYGTKVEVKNLNSFRAVRNAIDYEVKRQQQVVEEGNQVRQVTMGWDEEAGVTREQRSKETSEDYRYFPEPDLLNIQLQEDWINRLKDGLPELPTVKADRFSSEYGLNTQDISVITEDRSISDYFEAVLTFDNIEPKQAANWVLGEVFRLLNEETQDGHITVTPKDLAKIISLVSKGTINQNAARTVFSEMWEHGGDPEDIIKSKGLGQISDTNELDQAVAQVIANEPEAAAKIQNGNLKPIQFLMGQVMKETRGKANPRLVQELIKQQLEK